MMLLFKERNLEIKNGVFYNHRFLLLIFEFIKLFHS